MAIPSYFVEQVKARMRVSEVISKRLRVERKGREFISICPFHNDSKPSLTINDEKGFYHCFACGAHGSAFDFLMNYEGLSFVEAVEKLASQLGMQVPKENPQEAQKNAIKKDLNQVMELVCRYYEQHLHLPQGKAALTQLCERGLSTDTIKKFRLGFAPDISGHFIGAMKKQGVKEQQLIDTGMLIEPEDSLRKPYPRFRGRIMFPIFDLYGKPIAFGGRIMQGEGPKYLNSPETLLFHKGHILFAYHHAAVKARQKKQMIVGEGYMDVIAMHQAGFDTAVAALGTALTESQLALLWRHTGEPILCFDGDAAGQKAAWRACMRALPLLKPSVGLKFITLPEGEDPDSLIQKKAADEFALLLARAVPISEKIWQYIIDGRKLTTPEEAAEVDGEIDKICVEIKDQTIKAHMVNFLRYRLWKRLGMQPPEQLKIQNANHLAKKHKFFPNDSRFQKNLAPVSSFEAKKQRVNKVQTCEQILLLTLIAHPKLYDHVEERLIASHFSDKRLDALRQEVMKILSHETNLEFVELADYLKKRGYADLLNQLALLFKDGFYAAHKFMDPNVDISKALKGWDDIWEKWWDIPQEKAEIQYLKQQVKEDVEKSIQGIKEIKQREWSRQNRDNE